MLGDGANTWMDVPECIEFDSWSGLATKSPDPDSLIGCWLFCLFVCTHILAVSREHRWESESMMVGGRRGRGEETLA
jgi:hypothetical protein